MKDNNFTHICKNFSSKVDLKGKIQKLCVGILPATALVLFASTVMYWNSRNYGIVLAYDGKEIATVQNEQTFEKASHLIQNQMAINGNVGSSIPTPECKIAVIDNSHCVSPFEVKDKIIQQSNTQIEKAYGVYVNSNLLCVSKDDSKVNEYLQELLETSKQDNNVQAEFAEKIEIVFGLYRQADIVNNEELYSRIFNGINNQSENNSYNKLIHVKVFKNEEREEELPYSIIKSDDSSEYIGTEKVKQNGQKGIRKIIDKVTYIDNIEVNRENLGVQITQDPIDEKVSVGTKEKLKPVNKNNISNNQNNVQTNSKGLCWPVPYTRSVTSEYGPRDGSFHKGIDIAAAGIGGQNIVAATDGTVRTNANGNGYGNHIEIVNGNGMSTVYAHCKQLLVKNGQKVSKGQVIAIVGSTGQSTGNHLHFEVRINGTPQNPRKYV